MLLSKAERIRKNLSDEKTENIYEFSKFLYVLNTGFNADSLNDVNDMDFEAVINTINAHYKA